MSEKNRNILKHAITQLPGFKIRKPEIWGRIEKVLEKKEKMESALQSGLPHFHAPDALWEKVEAELQAQHPVLRKAISEMPVSTVPAGTWDKIEILLDKQVSLRIRKRVFFMAKMAASILVFMSIAYGILKYRENRKENLTRTTFERMELSNGIEAIYNPALCKSNPRVCQTELFKDLDRQREEIGKEINTMKTLINNKDPQMMKYYHRLVNERVEIEKRMVKLIIES